MNKRTIYLLLVILLIIALLFVLGGLFFYYKKMGIPTNQLTPTNQNHKPTQAEINKALSEVKSDTPLTPEVQKQINNAFDGVKSTSTTKTTTGTQYNQGGAEMTAEQRAAIDAALKGTH